MKKDVNIIIGILALVIVAFIVGYRFYSKPAATPAPEAAAPAESGQVPVPAANLQTLMGDGTPSKGPMMAKVIVLEYLDPECEACKAFHPRVKKILAEFDGKIRYMVRHMPYHGNSQLAIIALEAALEQNKYFEMLDLFLENQEEWGHKATDPNSFFTKYAQKAGLDIAKFKKDLQNPEYLERVKKDKRDGEASGVTGTPTFFVNGALLTELGDEPLRSAITQALTK